jgi:hypothetical protein
MSIWYDDAVSVIMRRGGSVKRWTVGIVILVVVIGGVGVGTLAYRVPSAHPIVDEPHPDRQPMEGRPDPLLPAPSLTAVPVSDPESVLLAPTDVSMNPPTIPPTTPPPTMMPYPTPIPPVPRPAPTPNGDAPVLPVYPPDAMDRLVAAVQCQFPHAQYYPDLHHDALVDIAIRWRDGVTTDTYIDALLYYLANGLRIGIVMVDTDVVRPPTRSDTVWSCAEMLSQQQIVIAVETFEIIPTIFSFVPVIEQDGRIIVFLAYE